MSAAGLPSARMLRWIAGLAAGVALCWLAVGKVDTTRVVPVLLRARVPYLLAALTITGAAYGVRALRWQRLLRIDPRQPAPRHLFAILMIGYFLNNVLPARGGELVRIGLTRRYNGTPPAGTLATVVAERVMDGFVLSAIGLAAMGSAMRLELPWLDVLAGVFVIAFAVLIVLGRKRARVLAWLARPKPLLPQRAWLFVARHASTLLTQLAPIAGRTGIGVALPLTCVVWLLESIAYACVAAAFDVHLGVAAVVTFVVVVNFASVAPTPGGLGAVELAASSALTHAGVPGETALVLASVQHALHYLLSFVLALVHAARLGLLTRHAPIALTAGETELLAAAPLRGSD